MATCAWCGKNETAPFSEVCRDCRFAAADAGGPNPKTVAAEAYPPQCRTCGRTPEEHRGVACGLEGAAAGKVVPLPLREIEGRRVEPDPAMVRLLEEILAKVKAGEIIGLAAAWEYTGHGCGYHVVHDQFSYPGLLVAHLEVAKLAIVERHLKRRDD